jgi:hypothetical protein
MSIRTDDVLHFLVSRSGAPSTFGAQLDRMRFGLQATPDPFRARDDAEAAMLETAHLLRCIDEFTQKAEFRQAGVPSAYKKLEKMQKASNLGQGFIAISVLRSYQEWATTSQERALVEVYRYLAKVAPDAVPNPPMTEPDLTQAFRLGKARRCRDLAAEVYADSLLALGAFLNSFNRRKKR